MVSCPGFCYAALPLDLIKHQQGRIALYVCAGHNSDICMSWRLQNIVSDLNYQAWYHLVENTLMSP